MTLREWHERQHRRHELMHKRRERWYRRHADPAEAPSRLRRRIFRWFGAAIVISGLVAFLMARALMSGEWSADLRRAQGFATGEIARVWDDPEGLDALLGRVVTGFDVRVRLMDAAGRTRAEAGPPCVSEVWTKPIERAGTVLGQVEVCGTKHPTVKLLFILPFIVAGCLLWGASGRIAHRLTRPLGSLVKVTQEIGAGNLEARARIDCRSGDEVGMLAVAINDMATRIERQLKEQRMLLAAVSHELRTPLGHLRILTDMARERGAGPKTFDEIDAEIKEIDDLVGELLARSRLDFTEVSSAPLDAGELVQRAGERSGVAVDKIVVEGGPHPLRGDPTLLLRALANLVDNATKHGGGLDRLSVAREGDEVVITALDRGPGLPPGEESRVLEPFYRRQENGMLGLGLALVDRIAKAHGGRAIAENREGGGARVGMAIPANFPVAVA